MFELAIQLKDLLNPEFYIQHGGLWLFLFIVFAETGLFAGFFLPGDSLLFVAGIYSNELASELYNLNNDFLNISNSDNNQVAASDVFMTQISHQNSAAGSLSPVSRTTAVSFPPRVAVIDYAAGGMISIYASSGNNASSLIATTLSIYFIQKDV